MRPRPDQLRGQVEENLRQLGRDHLDLVNLRTLLVSKPVGEHFAALAALRDAGLVRHLGLSNVTVGQIDEALAIARALRPPTVPPVKQLTALPGEHLRLDPHEARPRPRFGATQCTMTGWQKTMSPGSPVSSTTRSGTPSTTVSRVHEGGDPVGR